LGSSSDDGDDDHKDVDDDILSGNSFSPASADVLLALLVETIFIWPFQPPILSNRVVTKMLLVPVTLCNNVFLLLTLPHL
jgi:hypothetical protein